MQHTDIANQRLFNQQISQKAFKAPDDVVRWMGAIQAQDYLASLWAMGLRTPHTSESDIEKAISDRKIVRTWPMRGTLHFVASEDVRWMLRLLTPRVIRSSAGRHRELELDETVFTRSRKLFEGALQGGNHLTRQELYRVLEQAGISTGNQRGYHILNFLAQTEVICFGLRRGKQHTFTLLDEWIPNGLEFEGEEAVAELAMRYLCSHGPATEYDFSAWSGLTITAARQGLEMVKSNFLQADVDGQTYWFSESSTDAAKNPANVQSLPAFDEMLCGYKDRSAILDSKHARSIILKNGILNPTVVINGKVAGSWKRTLKKEKVIIEIRPFLPFGKSHEKAVIEATKRYGKFIGLPVELLITNSK